MSKIKKSKEESAMLYFLKSKILSLRKIESRLKIEGKDGWEAMDIRNSYSLKDSDCGKLFLYSETEILNFLKSASIESRKGFIDTWKKENPPRKLNSYQDTFLIAKNEKSFNNILDGETKNIIQTFFAIEKEIVGKCQYDTCNVGKLEVAHWERDRGEIFQDCALKNKTPDGEYFKYDIYKTMADYLEEHSKPNAFRFLCHGHHVKLHKLIRAVEKGIKPMSELINFKRRIIDKQNLKKY